MRYRRLDWCVSGSAPVTRTPDFRHQDQHAIVNSRMYGALQIDWLNSRMYGALQIDWR